MWFFGGVVVGGLVMGYFAVKIIEELYEED